MLIETRHIYCCCECSIVSSVSIINIDTNTVIFDLAVSASLEYATGSVNAHKADI